MKNCRRTFMFSPPLEVAAQIEQMVTTCDTPANRLFTQLVTEALKHVTLKTKTIEEIVLEWPKGAE